MSNGRMNQIEVLLRLSENARDKGDELIRDQSQINTAHAKDLLELSRMIELAKSNIDNELARFQRWLPREQQQPPVERLPRAVVAGPNVPTPKERAS